jgi:hypothetical protein
MKSNALIATVFAVALALPAVAQGSSYSYSYGSSRVVQGGNGLATPSSSYIGAGTMSQSARGVQQGGLIPNPGLPAVNMGANVRTPGDNQYRGKSVYGAQPQQINGLQTTRMGAYVGSPGDGMRSDLGHPYVPMSQRQFGGGPAQQYYNGQPSGPGIMYKGRSSGGGVATYADQTFNSAEQRKF